MSMSNRFEHLFGPDSQDRENLPRHTREQVYMRYRLMFADERAPKRKRQQFLKAFHPDKRIANGRVFTEPELNAIVSTADHIFLGAKL